MRNVYAFRAHLNTDTSVIRAKKRFTVKKLICSY